MPKRATVPDPEKEIARYLAETIEKNVRQPGDVGLETTRYTVLVGVSFTGKNTLTDEAARFTAEAIVLTGAPDGVKIVSMKKFEVLREPA